MRQATCCQCGLTTTVRSFYSMNGETYCEPCVWKTAREAKESGKPAEYVALQDNSICARCGAYSGDSSDHPMVGTMPLCGNCVAQVSHWPYPTWLKASLAALLLLLVVALLHGRRYFHAGRTMYIGEHLIEENQYEKALPYLQETLRIAPESDKAVLLTAKAALAIGDVFTAQQALKGHNGGYFEDSSKPEVQEVKQNWDRAMRAFEEAQKASKLAQEDGHAAEAAKLMHDAASLYPEAKGLAIAAQIYDEGTAFEAKDYDAFLTIAEQQWQQFPGSSTAAGLASALACKFAVTGDPAYRQRAKEMLEMSRRKLGNDPAELQSFQEYSERIHHRLDSREIISKAVYDSRYRKAPTQAKE